MCTNNSCIFVQDLLEANPLLPADFLPAPSPAEPNRLRPLKMKNPLFSGGILEALNHQWGASSWNELFTSTWNITDLFKIQILWAPFIDAQNLLAKDPQVWIPRTRENPWESFLLVLKMVPMLWLDTQATISSKQPPSRQTGTTYN